MKPLDPRLLRYARSTRGFIALAVILGVVTALLVILALGAPSLRRFMIQDEFAERLMERSTSDAQVK